MSKSKVNYGEKIEAVEKYRLGESSQERLASEYGVGRSTLREWLAIYESQGSAGLQPKPNNNCYSKELKLQAVHAYLNGEGSQEDICKKYQVLSRRQLRDWIAMYNGQKEHRAANYAGKDILMTKGRKTTLDERVEIVAFCIEHGRDYALTVQNFGVSYQQIYSWAKKYEAAGVDGLTDRRGKAKPESEMTEAEKLKAENKILTAKIKDLEMENALIKKVKEVERGCL